MATLATKPTPTARHAEQATLSLRHPGCDAAIARYQSHPDLALRLALAREIAQTRGPELTLAYRNLVAVVAGWRRRRGADGVPQPEREPCVVLVVKTKWKPGATPRDARQILPRHLLVGAEVDGTRQLFAVPTDVQRAKTFLGGRAYSQHAVRVDDPAPGRSVCGTVTCAVQLSRTDGSPPETLALSAMHVFTPYAEVQAGPSTTPARLHTAHQKPVIGRTTMLRGALRWSDPDDPAGPNFSFDAQLAAIPLPWLRTQLAAMPLSATHPWVTGPEALDRLNSPDFVAVMRTADNRVSQVPVQIQLHQLSTDLGAIPLEYTLRAAGTAAAQADPDAPLATVVIYHWELLQFDVLGTDRPEPGDSGAPVLAPLPGGGLTLVGMFIAGDSALRKAYVLPAWQLFDALNWGEDQVLGIRPVNMP
nr:hypothetical protein [uncultured Albidiferax sp.]